ncbi:uncharacterized protein SEPMUDRAFT_152312 [Sphaerulina musiva SO2202]|uniref:Uncharacterized protein n=1 Tax=Sphaerulina musiva (strain SO2202) TaxID=692275 RepID=M3CWF1_SPHMS|nr:uncharacterized protein SEPMUDRAFT_152312 [Sphaerulina musiva SO2202]EMF07996.1 hypothetical protein SEPMUDRAFT_152312 [Sphaerulina musiva SO2202]
MIGTDKTNPLHVDSGTSYRSHVPGDPSLAASESFSAQERQQGVLSSIVQASSHNALVPEIRENARERSMGSHSHLQDNTWPWHAAL